ITIETNSAQPPAPPGWADRSYSERAEITRDAVETVLPAVLAWVGRDDRFAGRFEGPLVTPGGYRSKTSPSVQLVLRAAPGDASHVGAVLGFVFRQWAVMVSNADVRHVLADARRSAALVRIDRIDGRLDADLAHAFFLHAGQTAPGLALGYTSFGNQLLYLNLRDAAGNPHSQLNDLAFAERLKVAAERFSRGALRVSPPVVVDAWFVENDWAAAPTGSQYLALIGAEAAQAQARLLQARADAFARDAARRRGPR
ncbi:MAG: hypothetical protein AB7G15_14205, partial [Alphaproteobacteria bacterium]